MFGANAFMVVASWVCWSIKSKKFPLSRSRVSTTKEDRERMILKKNGTIRGRACILILLLLINFCVDYDCKKKNYVDWLQISMISCDFLRVCWFPSFLGLGLCLSFLDMLPLFSQFSGFLELMIPTIIFPIPSFVTWRDDLPLLLDLRVHFFLTHPHQLICLSSCVTWQDDLHLLLDFGVHKTFFWNTSTSISSYVIRRSEKSYLHSHIAFSFPLLLLLTLFLIPLLFILLQGTRASPRGNIHNTWVHIERFNIAKKQANIFPVLGGRGFFGGGFIMKKGWVGRI